MGVTSTFRFKMTNQELGRKWGKIGSEVWKKAGATNVRTFSVMFGPNVGQWIFAIELPDLAAFERARNQVGASPESKQWNEEFAKAGTVLMDIGVLSDITL
jgi:hypothetical protein